MYSFEESLERTGEFATVEEVHFPIVFASGLPEAAVHEMVVFETGQMGYVTELRKDYVHIALIAPEPVQPGTRLTRVGTKIAVEVGPMQRGHVIDPLGRPFIPGEDFGEPEESRYIDTRPLPIGKRKKIERQIITGTTVVDVLVPLAAGQREAVIGDLKTGKTSFLLATAKSHAEHGIVVYAAIGRAWSEIRRITDFIEEQANPNNIIVVATSAEDIPSLITLTPYAAMTVAEYWRDQGEDVLLILHDLSTHARYYREIALLEKQFPGRESYPGDIFYAHARLLERAGNFLHPETGSCSITCLAVGETIEGRVSNYIISNLIGITDGHLQFDAARYAQGMRPAVHVSASVTRVGRKVQSNLLKQLNLALSSHFYEYDKAQQFTKFGSELNKATQNVLATGDRLLGLFSQPAFLTVPIPVQVILTIMIWQGWMNKQPEQTPAHWRDHLIQQYNARKDVRSMLDAITEIEELDEAVRIIGQSRSKIEELCQAVTV